VIYVSYVIRF